MMSSKDGVGQVIKTFVAVVALIALTGRFRVIKATLDDVFESREMLGVTSKLG